MSNSKHNFYEILNVTNTASFNELKSNYKQLILQCHPDKLQQQLGIEMNNVEINYDDPNNLKEFVAITEAWNCLKDPVKRKQYDAELLLNKFHTHNNIYAHIKLSEMKKQPNTGDCYKEEIEELESKESGRKEEGEGEEMKYIYTYDCRCGGQYIVDESAEQYCRSVSNHDTKINKSDNNDIDDDANNKSINDSTTETTNIIKCKNNGGGGIGAGGGSEGVVQDNNDDYDDCIDKEVDGELIVECSECSLAIILNG